MHKFISFNFDRLRTWRCVWLGNYNDDWK